MVPRVSVIIPAHNAEGFLAEALASVCSQTFEDWEAVVADDASSDGTAAVARSFGPRVRVVVSPVNEGPAGARNRALRASRGDLVAFLDADDLWDARYLELLVGAFDTASAEGRRVGVVTADARIETPEGMLRKTYGQLKGLPASRTLAQMLVANAVFISAIVPRAVMDEVGDFCPQLFGTEDYDLWLRIMERGYAIVSVDEVLCVYRLRSTSVSRDASRMARSLQLTYRRAIERGRLSSRELRVARRQLRLQRAVEQVGALLAERRQGDSGIRRLGSATPLLLRVALENPDRWGAAARALAGRRTPLSQLP